MQTVPVVEPGADQVLIRVYAAGVNPTDWKTRAASPGYAPTKGIVILGGDVAGVVEKLGSGVTTLKVGDPVFAAIQRTQSPLNGGYSHFTLAPVASVGPKPASMTYAEAAGLGIAAVAGVRAVYDTKVAKGQRVLITGIAGGVGSAAAQAAKARGAYVIGTATAQHNAYLKSLGVDEVIDYSKVKFEDQVKDVDVVVDTVGADTAERALVTIKKTGLYVSVAGRDLEARCAAAGVTCLGRQTPRESVKPAHDEIGALSAAGKFKVYVEKSFPLAQAGQAQVLGEAGHTEGKIILIVDAAKAGQK
jgi:NADPH:quinone reductase-like Zn-dependent oxidoreductase